MPDFPPDSPPISPTLVGDSATFLDVRLSPRTRLLYAVLLAKLPAHTDAGPEEKLLQELPALVGLGADEREKVRLMMGELVEYGVLSRIEHAGRKEAMWHVHRLPRAADDTQRVCRTCTGCGACACAELSEFPFPAFVEPKCTPCQAMDAR